MAFLLFLKKGEQISENSPEYGTYSAIKFACFVWDLKEPTMESYYGYSHSQIKKNQ